MNEHEVAVSGTFIDWTTYAAPEAEVLVRGLRARHSLDIVKAVPLRGAVLTIGSLRLAYDLRRSTPAGAGGWRLTVSAGIRQENGTYRCAFAFLARWCARRVGVGVSPWQVGLTSDHLPRVG